MEDNMKEYYLEAISLIERLHRLFLEVIKCELDNIKVDDISNVQALVLYNLGGDQISIGELTVRGCYLGSNVSYNLKKMLQNGYVDQVTSKHDKRSYMVRLSSKGMALCKKLDAAFDRHLSMLQKDEFDGMEKLVLSLKGLEFFWNGVSVQRPAKFGFGDKRVRTFQ
jgi:DNA-binding MarR family transcriptional regulator